AGIEMSQKIWPVSKVNPAAGSDTTTIDHSCQTTKPRNSAKIDQPRFRRAMARPWPSHCTWSSGFQWSIQRPGLVTSAAAGAAWTAAGATCWGAVLVESVIVASGGRVTGEARADDARRRVFPRIVPVVNPASPPAHPGGRPL